MRLKKLVILGFKSFADKTVLHFDAGITCIVGPNGCGKSNIADAFRWVLGEQSAKSLRGNKMPDVIFAGTSHRKPLNFAEVSLTLTDIQGTLPIEYEEVTLTRRLHRSGESEYLLNGNLVRLKDLQNLFLDSGIGRNAFSIFEQGKIDQVISYTPLERRHIFEEAAGILRFLQRKREALKRLEQADQNFARAQDIYQEVEQQIKVLEEQAEKAKRFKENRELLENLEKSSYVLRWSLLEKKWLEAESRQQTQQSQLAELNQKRSELQLDGQQTKALLMQDEKTLRKKHEDLFKVRSEKEIFNREQASSQQRLQEAQQKEKKIKHELEDLRLSQKTRQHALREIQQKQKKIETEFHEAEKNLSSQREKVQLKEKEVNQLRSHLQQKQQLHLKLLQEESQLSSEYKQHEARLENNLERKTQLQGRKNKGSEDLQQLASLVKEKKQQLNQVSALVDTHKDRLEQYEENLKSIAQQVDSNNKKIEEVRRKLVEQKARQKVLLRLRDDLEGFSTGSKRLLKESQSLQSALYSKIRPLYEFLKPEAEVAEIVAVLLRHYAQTLVVETQEDFQKVVEFAQEAAIQDYSLISLDWIRSLPASKKKGPLLKKVEINVLSEHFLGAVEEAPSYQEALEFFSKKAPCDVWICNQGSYLDLKGVLCQVKANENQVFLRESELSSLEEELAKSEEILQELDIQLQKLQQHRTQVQMERSELDKMLRRDEMKLVEVNFGLQRCLGDQEKVRIELEQIDKDLLALALATEQQQILVKQLQDRCQKIKQELIGVHQEYNFLEKELEMQLGALRIQQQDQNERNEFYQQLGEQRQHLVHELNVLEVKESEYNKQEQRLIEEIEDLEEIQTKIKSQEPTFKHSLESIEMRHQQASLECAELEKGIEIYKQAIEKIESEMLILQEQIRGSEGLSNQFSIQAVQHRSSAQSLEHELQERYQLTIEEAKTQVTFTKSLDQTERQIRSLRQTLQSAGDINLASIEDLEKHRERHAFLKHQLDDMSVSKEELLEIITQLDTESRKLFRQTFDAIRQNFKKNFEILFNGGEADLQFTEADNILEAGVEIIAKPPGKQMRSISLLSGGEKCLTAVALLFSIFEVKPAPFCILDEIDAPLDDTNVERFTNVVKHFINRCQFLIITHNKRTMAIGDVLFGVSMEEKGVSKLLSLEFAHSEAPEASLV